MKVSLSTTVITQWQPYKMGNCSKYTVLMSVLWVFCRTFSWQDMSTLSNLFENVTKTLAATAGNLSAYTNNFPSVVENSMGVFS